MQKAVQAANSTVYRLLLFGKDNAMNTTDELCRIINTMKLVRSVTLENYYNIQRDRFEKVLTVVFSPELVYYGERLLTVRFSNTVNADIGGMLSVYSPYVEICDISEYGWENIHYRISEIEGHFDFKFESCSYEWSEPIEIS